MRKNFVVLVALVLTAVATEHSHENSEVTDEQSIPFLSFQEIRKIEMRQHGNEIFCAKRAYGSGNSWTVDVRGKKMRANGNALENIYVEAVSRKNDRSDIGPIYEVWIESNDGDKRVSTLPVNYANDKIFRNHVKVEIGDTTVTNENNEQPIEDVILQNILSHSVLTSGVDWCQALKIVHDGTEIILGRSDSNWYFKKPASDIPVSKEAVGEFFSGLKNLNASNVLYTFEEINHPAIVIDLYGDKNLEKISFSKRTSGEFVVSNAKSKTSYLVDSKDVDDLLKSIGNLSKVKIFDGCDVIKELTVDLTGGHEKFSIHSADDGSRWQFTYLHDGNLKIKDITSSEAESLISFLKKTESAAILSTGTNKLEKNGVSFSIKISYTDEPPRTAEFYKCDDKLFAIIGTPPAQFEINSSFVPMLFHILRSYIVEDGMVL